MNRTALKHQPIALNEVRYRPEQLALGERYYRLFTGMAFGECLPDCYHSVGATIWGHFMQVQEEAYRTGNRLASYDVVRNEIEAIRVNWPAIASELILRDPDINAREIVIVEKGNGSRAAMMHKTLKQIECLQGAGGAVKL